ncbi:DUF2508 family protein [Lactobacillus sp. PV037]|uniref:YaaL family protein n=1 Tax=unclassified Lactobacillus TaxID=2620435 RepID=UPI00223EA7C2|nr:MULTISPECIES: YaaL family protein [unclassified Lactobacillus]QNQ81881.1 DUF2508 family protein [Lactobacillus sp. PV012]QNQ84080.1 DUF2508 family protein [Lactobacillus sp. PV037]
MREKIDIKKVGDGRLIATVTRLQRQIAMQKTFEPTTLDLSTDNRIADKILHAKYNFLYNEARRRHTASSNSDSVITQ